MLDSKGNKVGAVNYAQRQYPGIIHCGDNQTGDGKGDDETIILNLA